MGLEGMKVVGFKIGRASDNADEYDFSGGCCHLNKSH